MNCKIKDTGLGKGTYACQDFRENEIICQLTGKMQKHATAFTVQVSPHEHIVPLFGKYLNHSCSPNCYFEHTDRTFRALKPIKNGDEITFNYCTTEYKMASPFDCFCGSENCYHTVQGYKYLTEKQKQNIDAFIPDYFR